MVYTNPQVLLSLYRSVGNAYIAWFVSCIYVCDTAFIDRAILRTIFLPNETPSGVLWANHEKNWPRNFSQAQRQYVWARNSLLISSVDPARNILFVCVTEKTEKHPGKVPGLSLFKNGTVLIPLTIVCLPRMVRQLRRPKDQEEQTDYSLTVQQIPMPASLWKQ